MNENLLRWVEGDPTLTTDERDGVVQDLIDSGEAWRLEGAVGRLAMEAIESGRNVLGKEGHRDYYGNYVPSRYEVEPGTKGSALYAKNLTGKEYD